MSGWWSVLILALAVGIGGGLFVVWLAGKISH